LVYLFSGRTQIEGVENRALRRVFGTVRDEVRGRWIKVHNEELRSSHSSQNIVLIVKLRRMTGKGYGRV
jgi:hypothetical protein